MMPQSNSTPGRLPQRSSLRILLRCMRSPYRRARLLRAGSGASAKGGEDCVSFRTEFLYAMRVYFAPEVGMVRVMARVGRFVVQKTLRIQ
jgi:hypothetical protein